MTDELKDSPSLEKRTPHSPVPWTRDDLAIVLPNGCVLARMELNHRLRGKDRSEDNAYAEANAAFIVQAVNSFDALVKALEEINLMACFASEENIDSREAMLLKIGETARAAINKGAQP